MGSAVQCQARIPASHPGSLCLQQTGWVGPLQRAWSGCCFPSRSCSGPRYILECVMPARTGLCLNRAEETSRRPAALQGCTPCRGFAQRWLQGCPILHWYLEALASSWCCRLTGTVKAPLANSLHPSLLWHGMQRGVRLVHGFPAPTSVWAAP